MNIVVLLGGTSPERSVSLSSGIACARALRDDGHSVSLIDPAFGTNQPVELQRALDENRDLPESVRDYIPASNLPVVESLLSDSVRQSHCVFIGLHGRWGEDGTIQAVLDLMGIPYTGSGTLASALAMDKVMSKHIFVRENIPTAPWIDFPAGTHPDDIPDRVEKKLSYPVVVKPNDQGSTVGISIVRDRTELGPAVELAERYSASILIEEFIAGRELTVAVLAGQAMPVLEIRPKTGFYDFTHKYTKGMTEYIVPADIPAAVAARIQSEALSAFESLGCRGYGRIDFRLTDDNRSFCLEVNTLPGMTELSLVPKAAAAVGISFIELCRRILATAVGERSF